VDDDKLANQLVDKLFTKIDLNGDGRISMSEITHALVGLGISDAGQIAVDLMEKGDTDLSGDLDRDEFAVLLSAIETGGLQYSFQLLFHAFDVDENGDIDDAELERLFLFLDVPLSVFERRKLFTRVDAGGVGRLSSNEVLEVLDGL
jgi:Ca2+-binding EF-hand superfamily protein